MRSFVPLYIQTRLPLTSTCSTVILITLSSTKWCAQNIYQALDHAGIIYIYTPGLSMDDVSRFGGIKIEKCQATVDELLKDHTHVAVIPEGPYVVGKVQQ
ncbi:MAG: hypothetical protein GY799_11240 [Desulfobulbaceae bacterium]|nr:hypothetical protein [Desulfobulbaceae bacterium]